MFKQACIFALIAVSFPAALLSLLSPSATLVDYLGGGTRTETARQLPEPLPSATAPPPAAAAAPGPTPTPPPPPTATPRPTPAPPPTATPQPTPTPAPLPQLEGVEFVSVAENRNDAAASPTGGAPGGETGGWYFYFDRIAVELTLSEPVAVQGQPYLELLIGDDTRPAAYHSGSGSRQLLFHYRVQAGDYDADGIALPRNALKLGGGSINGRYGGPDLAAAAGATQQPGQPAHKVDGGQGNRPPNFAAAAGPPAVYLPGAAIPERTLPGASGGNGTLAYSLHLQPGPCAAAGTDEVQGDGGPGDAAAPESLPPWMAYTPPGPGAAAGGGVISPADGMTPDSGLHGCLRLRAHDADPDRSAADRAELSFNLTVKFDYDRDDDGLIEISELSQLNAIRYDLDGDGAPDAGDEASYAAAFPDAVDGMGCPTTPAAAAAPDPDAAGGCTGYELAADLDFDTDGDGATYTETDGRITPDADDAYYRDGRGWRPIGHRIRRFTAAFHGNGHTIANLFIQPDDTRLEPGAPDDTRNYLDVGLFGAVDRGGQVRDLGLLQARINLRRHASYRDSHTSTNLGLLIGINTGAVSGSYADGVITAALTGPPSAHVPLLNVGGLIGSNRGTATASYSAVSITAAGRSENGRPLRSRGQIDNLRVGGLTGRNGGEITACYATGAVAVYYGRRVGGLVGRNINRITASYATGPVKVHYVLDSGGLAGLSDTRQARIVASYALGLLTSSSGGRSGGLVSSQFPDEAQTFDSYWDLSASGQYASDAGAGLTTRELQAPTGYTGIYANWNLSLAAAAAAGATAGEDGPWDFGNERQYPALRYGGLDPERQRRNFLHPANGDAPVVGQPVETAGPEGWSWQWQRETAGVWRRIDGAAGRRYTPSAADVGHRLRAIASYAEGGLPRTVITANTAAVRPAPQPTEDAPDAPGNPDAAPPPSAGETLRHRQIRLRITNHQLRIKGRCGVGASPKKPSPSGRTPR